MSESAGFMWELVKISPSNIKKLNNRFVSSIVIGVLAFICLNLLLILFPIYQNEHFDIHKYFYVRYLYIFSMLGSFLFVPISSVLIIINTFKYIRRVNIITNGNYHLSEKEVLLCLLIPIINIVYLIVLIGTIIIRNYKIEYKTNTIKLMNYPLLVLKLIIYIFLRSFMIYVLYKETDRILVSKCIIDENK